jgi:hypothetical protein
MTPQERDLIQGVFDRVAHNAGGPKDAEAEAMIEDNVRRHPDAPYALVQAVIVQEMGLQQATARINELQQQLDAARQANQGRAPSGGFLAGASPWGGGSVPRSGPAYAPPPQQSAPLPAGQPYAAAPQQPMAGLGGQPASGAGGFLRSAATMAAGVAGGALIAEGISSLFGGHHLGGGFGGGFGGAGPWGGVPNETVENVTVNNYYGDQDDQRQDYAQQDDGQDDSIQDASFDDSDSGFGGGFDDSSDV